MSEQEEILSLAKKSIENIFHTGESLVIDPKNISPHLLEKGACFVTLTISGQLRGCIGSLTATQELYKDIIANAVHAAFDDNRFTPLTEEEFKNVEIEVSILSAPQELKFNSPDDLLKKLQPNADGVVLEYNGHSATYLPQVWEDLQDKEMFLSSLCQKAGLPDDTWSTAPVKISVYSVEIVK